MGIRVGKRERKKSNQVKREIGKGERKKKVKVGKEENWKGRERARKSKNE